MSVIERMRREWTWRGRGRNRQPHVTITIERGGSEHVYRFSPPLDPELDVEITTLLAKVRGVQRIRFIRLAGADESALIIGYDPDAKNGLLDRIVRAIVRTTAKCEATLANLTRSRE